MAYLTLPIEVRRNASQSSVNVLPSIEERGSSYEERRIFSDDEMGLQKVSSSEPSSSQRSESPDDWYGWLYGPDYVAGDGRQSTSSGSTVTQYGLPGLGYFELPCPVAPPRVHTPPVPYYPPALESAYDSPRTFTEHRANGRTRLGDSRRAQVRLRNRRELYGKPLRESSVGRSVLELSSRPWYRLPNGLVAMQFEASESTWRANDMSNLINWLGCGAYAHRSQMLNAIAVVNFHCLNQRMFESGVPRIVPSAVPADWPRPCTESKRNYQRGAYFLADNFVSKHQLP